APTGRAWRALFGDPAPVVRGTELELMLPPWGVRVLTTDPEFNPSRKRYDEEAAQARPPRPLVLEAGNAIPNASFEGDDNGDGVPDGWHIRFPFSAARDTAVRQQGEASFRFESETAGFAPLAVLNEVKVRPGARYRLSGQVRSDTAGVKARIYAEWVTEGVFHSHVVPWAEPSSAWSPLQIEFTAAPNPAGRLYVVVQIKDQGRVWFDSLKLEEVTP
ncbi:MAG: hypothetical protein HUU35_08980, partial [Armatimonadetes bacterium]|nr:hypothetical protein [Armatimonadota bacterium]